MANVNGDAACVLQVNVGTSRGLEWQGRTIRTAIWKHRIDGPVALNGLNFVGDDQADRSVHGGEDKAVHAYAIEDYEYWAGTETFEVHPGLFGDNLPVQGLDLRGALVGERWRVGTALLLRAGDTVRVTVRPDHGACRETTQKSEERFIEPSLAFQIRHLPCVRDPHQLGLT
jgi:MOSC domain